MSIYIISLFVSFVGFSTATTYQHPNFHYNWRTFIYGLISSPSRVYPQPLMVSNYIQAYTKEAVIWPFQDNFHLPILTQKRMTYLLRSQRRTVYPIRSRNFPTQRRTVYPLRNQNFLTQRRTVYQLRSRNFPTQRRTVYSLRNQNFLTQRRTVYPIRSRNFPTQRRTVYPLRNQNFPTQRRTVYPIRTPNFPTQMRTVYPIGSRNFQTQRRTVYPLRSRNIPTQRRTVIQVRSRYFPTQRRTVFPVRNSNFPNPLKNLNMYGIRSWNPLQPAVHRAPMPNMQNMIPQMPPRKVQFAVPGRQNRPTFPGIMSAPPSAVWDQKRSCQETGCEKGSVCVLENGWVCPIGKTDVTCRCQKGCRMQSTFIPLGNSTVVGACGSICSCNNVFEGVTCTQNPCGPLTKDKPTLGLVIDPALLFKPDNDPIQETTQTVMPDDDSISENIDIPDNEDRQLPDNEDGQLPDTEDGQLPDNEVGRLFQETTPSAMQVNGPSRGDFPVKSTKLNKNVAKNNFVSPFVPINYAGSIKIIPKRQPVFRNITAINKTAREIPEKIYDIPKDDIVFPELNKYIKEGKTMFPFARDMHENNESKKHKVGPVKSAELNNGFPKSFKLKKDKVVFSFAPFSV